MDRYSFRTQHVHVCEHASDAIVVCPEDDLCTGLSDIRLSSTSSEGRQQQHFHKTSPVSVVQQMALHTPEKKTKHGGDEGSSDESAQHEQENTFQNMFVHYQSQSDLTSQNPESVPQNLFCRYGLVVAMENDGFEVQLNSLAASPHPTPSRIPRKAVTSPIKVQLDNLLKIARTPEFNRYGFPKNSLLDSDATPIKSPEPCRSLISDLCCGSETTLFCNNGDENVTVLRRKDAIQDTISVLLARPIGSEDWCSSWQAWTYFDMNESNELSRDVKENVKQVLRNRAFDMNAKTTRIKKLKGDLCPFEVTPEKKLHHSVPLGLNRSFCLSDQPSRKEALNALPLLTVREERSTVHAAVSVWESVHQQCTHQHKPVESPFVIRSRGLFDDETCYDSDPEETTRRRPSPNGNRRRTSTFLKQGALDERLSQTQQDSIPVNNLATVQDDELAKILVQELLNERFTLIWHPCTSDINCIQSRPIGIKAWIERGQQLRETVIQPKLYWQQVSKVDQKGALSDISTTLYNVDLLYITRVIEVKKVNRSHYPLAPRNKCLLVHSLDQKMLFEAGSEVERDRLAYALKLAVARLGSKIIVGDAGVFDEFFVTGNGVPGEAPVWTRA